MTAKITATPTATWSFSPTTMTVNGRTFGASYSVARGGDVYVFTGVQAAPGAQRIPVRMHITQDMPMHADALAAARLAAETETPKADPAPVEAPKAQAPAPVEAPKAQAPAPVQDATKAQAPAPVQDDAKAAKPAKAPKAAKPKAKPALAEAPKAQAPAPVQDDAKAAKAAKAPKAAKPKAKPAPVEAPKAQAPAPVQDAPKAAKPAKAPKAAKPKAKPAPVQEAPKAQAPAPVQDAAQAVCKPAADAAQAVCKAWIGSTITGKGWRIVFDGDAQRTRVIFDAKPTAAQAAAVDAARFYYSPSMGSYNKHLTCKAYKAAQALAQTLAGLAA